MLQEAGARPAYPTAPTKPDATLVNDWHAVGYSSDVKDGELVPVRLLGQELVLWRHDGKVHLWKDLCIHRGAQLSKGWVIDGKVVCPYHGWHYDGEAKCVFIPAHPDKPPPPRARAFSHRCEERYGLIWGSLGNPERDVPPFPEWGRQGFRGFHAGPYPFGANAFRSVENFVDATHFPFVHSGFNGEMANPDIINDYKVTKSPDGLFTTGIRVFQPYGDHRELPVNAEYRYRVLRPATAAFDKHVRISDPARAHLGSDDDHFCMLLNAQPIDEVNCIIRLVLAINFGPDLTEADIRRRQDAVFEQDRAIVETQHPERIPIDLREELHVGSDRLAVEYRRWLKELGVTYGTFGD